MTKIKALLGLTTLVVLLAISATPASAQYESTSTETEGNGSAGKTTFTTGTLSVTCEKAEGRWKIRLKTKQEKSKRGEHLNLLVQKWNNCKNSIFGGATVKECEPQQKQPVIHVTTELLMDVVTGCEVKAIGCVITVPAAGNENLGKITQETSGANLKGKYEVKEILGTYKGCGLAEKEKTGKEVGETLGEGVKAV
jgi:hypothetical protein